MRTDEIRDRERQPAPQRDQRAVLGIQRIVLRNRTAAEESVFVMQRYGLESPVLLELERPRAPLAPSIVEHLESTLARAAHELPIFEIVAGEFARGRVVARVVGQHFVAEIEAQYAAQRSPARVDDGQDFA